VAPDRPAAIGALQVFTLSFGTVVGIAWVFLLPAWLGAAGPIGTALAIVVGAIAILPVALCYVRVVRAFPGSGGEIRYALECFGGPGAVITGWLLLLAYGAVAAFCASAYQGLIVASLGLVAPGADLGLLAKVVTGITFALVAWANYRGIQTATWLQDLTVFLLIALTVALGITATAVGRAGNLEPRFGGGASGGIATVIATTPFLFAGFNTALQALGDLGPDQSSRKVSGALLGSLIAAALFYAGVVVAIGSTLPRDRLLSLSVPALEAVGVRLGLVAASAAMSLLAILALVTSWNAVFFAATRVFGLLVESRAFPGRSTRWASPAATVGLIAALSGLLALAGSSAVGTVVTFVSTCMTLIFLIVCLGLWKLERARARGGERPRVVLPIVGAAAAAALAVLSSRELPAALRGSLLGSIIIGGGLVLGLALGAAQLGRRTAAADFRRALGA
jgi:amino acid transporter